MPFIDYQEELRKLGPVAQRNAMGASNWRLVESGLAKWEDVVTKGRVRDFREVADRLDLSVDRMVRAGVRPDLARKAYDATHTEAHASAAKDRAALIKGLKAHGVKDERIAAEVGDLLASRVGVVGPGGSASGISPPPAPKPPKPAPAKVAAMKVARPPAPPSFGKSAAGPMEGLDPARTAESVEAASRMIGRPVTFADLATLAGAPDAAKVHVDAGSAIGVRIRWEMAGAEAARTIYRGEHGMMVLENDHLEVAEKLQGKGLGTAVFGRQVEEARRLGFYNIETLAIRDEGHNGYYTWPRLGYDGVIDPEFAAKLPAPLTSARRYSDLMETPEGRAWWKEHGDTITVHFSLDDGSRSMKTWESYLAEKAKGAGK
jgi:GNAT superfamily N-acetyltransferase